MTPPEPARKEAPPVHIAVILNVTAGTGHSPESRARLRARGAFVDVLESHTDVLNRHPPSASPHVLVLAGWLAFFIAGALFFSLAWNVSSAAAITQIDTRVANWLYGWHARNEPRRRETRHILPWISAGFRRRLPTSTHRVNESA